MSCNECFWCSLNHPLSNNKVCCNQKSENYNKLFSKEEANTKNYEHAELKETYNIDPYL